PWGDEALQRARELDRPIFLSIGYSACHWCHVMEHESFEDEATAKILNEHFVSIKVDREERPDLDQIYMTAVQIMTQHGGWPRSSTWPRARSITWPWAACMTTWAAAFIATVPMSAGWSPISRRCSTTTPSCRSPTSRRSRRRAIRSIAPWSRRR